VDKKASEQKEKFSLQQTHGIPVDAPRVIAVTSGKGGVGKTNIVGSLAVSFSRSGKRVIVLDADLGLANIDIIFGIYPEYNIGHVLTGEKSLSDVMVDGPEGIRIIPAGSGFVNLTSLTEGQKLSLLAEFEALDDMLDIFLIDTGAGISSNVLYFNLAADECIIVATAEPTSVTDAYAMMKVMSSQYGTKYFKLLINMVGDEKEAKLVYLNLIRAAERFLDGIMIDYVGFVPIDENMKRAVKSRGTVLKLYPDSASSLKIRSIADAILEAPRRPDADGNIKFFLKRFLNYKS
jgi:flagellar biosynthesis protein FlhG